MAKKKKKKSKQSRKLSHEIKIDQVLLHSRTILLFSPINDEKAEEIVSKLLSLDHLNSNPIYLVINSPGGSLSSGFSIIDTMKGIKAPVVTIINGEACSMAGVISIVGDKRLITKHSIWMAHDVSSGVSDYVSKMIDRIEFVSEYQKKLMSVLRDNTKLTEKDIERAKNGELWFFSEECLKKKIVDSIIQ